MVDVCLAPIPKPNLDRGEISENIQWRFNKDLVWTINNLVETEPSRKHFRADVLCLLTFVVRAGPAQKRSKLPSVEARQPLQVRNWKLESLTVGLIVHMLCRSKQFENPTRTRRDIPKKNSKFPFFGHMFGLQICMTAPKILFPDQGENWCRQSWRHKETIDISCTAQFVTHHEIWQIKNKNKNKNKKTVPIH